MDRGMCTYHGPFCVITYKNDIDKLEETEKKQWLFTNELTGVYGMCYNLPEDMWLSGITTKRSIFYR
jgi:hypothetical protein